MFDDDSAFSRSKSFHAPGKKLSFPANLVRITQQYVYLPTSARKRKKALAHDEGRAESAGRYSWQPLVEPNSKASQTGDSLTRDGRLRRRASDPRDYRWRKFRPAAAAESEDDAEADSDGDASTASSAAKDKRYFTARNALVPLADSDVEERRICAELVHRPFVDAADDDDDDDDATMSVETAIDAAQLVAAAAPLSDHHAQDKTLGDSTTGQPAAEVDENKLHSRSSSPSAAAAAATKESKVKERDKKTSSASVGDSAKNKQTVGQQLKNFFSPTYKSRLAEFRKLFRNIPEEEQFVIDYSCAYQNNPREILIPGRMYLSQGSVCFYANLFKWETNLTIPLKEIVSATKERSAKVIPNAIQLTTDSGTKHFFASFITRDKSYLMLFKLWQCALLDQAVSPGQLWSWAQHGYHETDLCSSEDELDVVIDEREAAKEAAEAAAALAKSPSAGEIGDSAAEKAVSSGFSDSETSKQLSATEFTVGAESADPPPQSSVSPPPTKETVGTCEKEPKSSKKARKKSEAAEKRQQRKRKSQRDTTESTEGAEPSTKNPVVTHEGVRSNESKASLLSFPAQEEFTESSENDELSCPCVAHEGRELLNCTYPMSVDQLFMLMFTDSDFYRKFMDSRGISDLKVDEWATDESNGTKRRTLAYTVPINATIGPKSCNVQKTEVCQQYSGGGVCCVKGEALNGGVPYCDSFRVTLTYCLARLSPQRCRLQVHGQVVFTRSLWQIIKGIIEKSSLAGMVEHYTAMDAALRAECELLGLAAAAAAQPISGLQHQPISDAPAPFVDSAPRDGPIQMTGSSLAGEFGFAAKLLLFTVVAMFLLNAFLCFKLLRADSQRTDVFANLDRTFLNFIQLLNQGEAKVEESGGGVIAAYRLHLQTIAAESVRNSMKQLNDIEVQLKNLRADLQSANSLFGHNPSSTASPPPHKESAHSQVTVNNEL